MEGREELALMDPVVECPFCEQEFETADTQVPFDFACPECKAVLRLTENHQLIVAD